MKYLNWMAEHWLLTVVLCNVALAVACGTLGRR